MFFCVQPKILFVVSNHYFVMFCWSLANFKFKLAEQFHTIFLTTTSLFFKIFFPSWPWHFLWQLVEICLKENVQKCLAYINNEVCHYMISGWMDPFLVEIQTMSMLLFYTGPLSRTKGFLLSLLNPSWVIWV